MIENKRREEKGERMTDFKNLDCQFIFQESNR